MPKTVICPPGMGHSAVPYSPGTRADNVVYVAGILALDSSMQTIGVGDVAEQTRYVIEAIKKVLEEAGGSLADVTYNHIFIRRLEDYKAMNEVYRKYFDVDPPARYCIRADLVPPDCLVEISSVAHLG